MSIATNFDVLLGDVAPTLLFGDPLRGKSAELARTFFEKLSAEARVRVTDTFEETINPNLMGITKLDQIIKGMWQSDWSPKRTSFNLFCTDFGALYCSAFMATSGLQVIFRSDTQLEHVSFWQAHSTREFFPFHKVAKALSNSAGENLVQMFLEASAQPGTPADALDAASRRQGRG